MKYLSKWQTESASVGKFNSGNTPHVALFSDTSAVKYIKKIKPLPPISYNVGDIVYLNEFVGGGSTYSCSPDLWDEEYGTPIGVIVAPMGLDAFDNPSFISLNYIGVDGDVDKEDFDLVYEGSIPDGGSFNDFTALPQIDRETGEILTNDSAMITMPGFINAELPTDVQTPYPNPRDKSAFYQLYSTDAIASPYDNSGFTGEIDEIPNLDWYVGSKLTVNGGGIISATNVFHYSLGNSIDYVDKLKNTVEMERACQKYNPLGTIGHWHLPSIAELAALAARITKINNTLNMLGGDPIICDFGASGNDSIGSCNILNTGSGTGGMAVNFGSVGDSTVDRDCVVVVRPTQSPTWHVYCRPFGVIGNMLS